VINESGAVNGFLLAISAILQEGRSVAETTVLLSRLSTDLRANGVIDDDATLNSIRASAKALDRNGLARNLRQRYESLGRPIEVPRFETFVLALDETQPTITSHSPAANVDDAPPGAAPYMVASDRLDAETVNSDTVELRASSGALVNAKVSYDDASRRITLQPAAPLTTGQTYNVTATTGIKDEAGNALAEALTWDFSVVSFPDASDLLLHATFSGDATDGSGNGNSGELVAGATFAEDRFGSSGQALSLNGTDGYARFTESVNLDGFDAFTVSIWAKPNEIAWSSGPNYPALIEKAYSWSLSAPLIFVNDAEGEGFRWRSARPAYFAQGEWVHKVFTYDSTAGTWSVIVNGTGNRSSLGQSAAVRDQDSKLWIGRRLGGVRDSYFNGELDDVRIYDRALSVSEANALFHEGGWMPD
jgi:hypothetical protein